MSTEPTESGNYRWQEDEWFTATDAPGYQESDEARERADIGEGEEWGQAHDFTVGTDKYEWVAWDIYLQVAPAYCAASLWGPTELPGGRDAQLCAWLFDGECISDERVWAMHEENEQMELSEPQLHIPKRAPEKAGMKDYGQYRYRRRVNPETGYITGGASTAVVVGDLPKEEFMTVISTILSMSDLMPDAVAEVRRFARQLKSAPNDMRDVEIVERVLYLADNGVKN